MKRFGVLLELIMFALAGFIMAVSLTSQADANPAAMWLGVVAAAAGVWVAGMPVNPTKRNKPRG